MDTIEGLIEGRTEGAKARSALALVIGIARAHRELPYASEDELRDALARIEEYGYEAMPWLREVA